MRGMGASFPEYLGMNLSPPAFGFPLVIRDDNAPSRDSWRDAAWGNPENIASWDPATEESAFFDDQRTEIIESSDEVALTALVDALAFLRSPPTANGQGGFGSEVMDEWLWGLRHWVRFESVLAELVGSDPTFAVFTDPLPSHPTDSPWLKG